jgi:hypothetical protein
MSNEVAPPRRFLLPTIAYGTVAALATVFVFYSYYIDSPGYVRMVSEDQWAEYCTSLCFLFASIVAAYLAWHASPLRRKAVFALIALLAFFIAGEEISWGQRLFDLSVPDPILERNQQNELTIHNLEAVRALKPQYVLAYLLVLWAGVSIASSRSSRVEGLLEKLALPVFPLSVIPLFLLFPAVYALHEPLGWVELIRKDEIAEWCLGIAVLVWSLDQIVVRHRISRPSGFALVGGLVGVSALILALSVALPRWVPTDDFKYQLQRIAAKSYPKKDLYPQAEKVYAYIYAHPELITDSTRINHGKLLTTLGRTDEADRVLMDALNEIGSGSRESSSTLRRMGIIYKLMGRAEDANAHFDRAIETDRRSVERATSPDDKARKLISIAKTLEEKGDAEGALAVAVEAESLSPSALLRVKIKRGYGF